ncbi:MAG: hypothetical protein WA798_10395 [Candidatus Acidiferrum sp.]
MTSRIWLRLAEILVPVILAITIYVSWQADRRDRAQLASQLAAAQKTISDAAASQHDRDTLLNQTLAQLAAQKQAATTPALILKDLPSALPLPAPITLQAPTPSTQPATSAAQTAGKPSQSVNAHNAALPSNPTPNSDAASTQDQSPDAVLPAADLKPLYDFAMDCKACQAKLAAAQGDLDDEKTENAALTKQRDAAVTAAKGGSALHRILRAAKWFALGAAAGAVAAKAVH